MIRAGLSVIGMIWAGAVAALELDLPSNARQTHSNNSALGTFLAPVGPFAEDAVEVVTIEGAVRRSAFRIPSPGLTPLQVLQPLREQLATAGYEIAFECEATACGGFDFRFAIEVLPAPDMQVNLRSYHVITGILGPKDAPQEVVTLLVSAAPAVSHLQIIQAGALSDTPDQFTRQGTVVGQDPTPEPEPEEPTPVVADGGLVETGVMVLSDLDFQTGSSDLTDAPSATLDALVRILNDMPGLRIALVGHTDSVGALDANISLSRRRAQAVRQRLINNHGIAANRIEADGVGYLSPVASNLTDEGRGQNRRVEAIVLSLEQ